MLADLAAALTLVGVTAYVVLGGADFGAGFWDLTAGGAERGAPVRAMIKRAMSPVWEANHVWLIFVLVMLWTAFPEAFGSITSTLAIPLFLAALGIVLRGGAFALKGEAATIAEARALGATFALSSVLVPFFLGAVGRSDRGGRGSGRQRGRRRVGKLDRDASDLRRPAGGGRRERTWLPSSSAPTRAEPSGRSWSARSARGRSARDSWRARSRSRASVVRTRRHPTSTTASPPAPGWRV